MGFLEYVIFFWLADFLFYKLRYTKANGPPVWYLFPFLGVLPFFLLPKRWFKPAWKWYSRNCPDVIICRFGFSPVVMVKNAAVRDVQNSENCVSRAGVGFEKAVGYVLTGKPYWSLADHNRKECDWRSSRKINLFALNVLPKERKFEKTAEVVDRFLQTIEKQKGGLWDYEEELTFAKIQESANVNLGGTFDCNNIHAFVKFLRATMKTVAFLLTVCTVPLKVLMWIEPLLPKIARMSVLKRVYAKFTRELLEKKMREIDEPSDFVEAVLRIKTPEAALEFIREMGFFNMVALTHTTQHTTMAALSYISIDKRIQQKVHDEVDRVVGTSPLKYEHLLNLHYLKACIHEGYRVTPPIPSIVRWTSAPAQIGGYTVDSNMRVVIHMATETVNPKNFPNPDDFVPERFINAEGVFESSKEFSVFSRGKRMCSGTDIAGLSAMVYCAKILQHFELVPERPDVEVPGFTGSCLPDAPAIPLRFVRRAGAPEIKSHAFDCSLTNFLKEVVEKEFAAA